MELKLANGLIVVGTPEEMRSFLSGSVQEVQQRKYQEEEANEEVPESNDACEYYSFSHGHFIKISDMHTLHIRNALLKMIRRGEKHKNAFDGLVYEYINRQEEEQHRDE